VLLNYAYNRKMGRGEVMILHACEKWVGSASISVNMYSSKKTASLTWKGEARCERH